MYRTRAVTQLLLEDIAGLEREVRSEGHADKNRDCEESIHRLSRARRRTILVIALDWAALLILVFARTRTGSFFSIGPGEDSIFALGILAIAVHSGFRLGQLEKLAAVRRVVEDLAGRSGPVADPPE